MKLPRLLLAVVLLISPGCERVRTLASKWTGKAPAASKPAVVSGPLVSELTSGAIDSFHLNRGRLSVLEYHASWSGPCRQLDPVWESIAADHGGLVVVGKVDVDQFRQLVKTERVKDIPDVRIYREGVLVDRFVGLLEEDELRKRIARLAKGIPPPSAATERPVAQKPTVRQTSKEWLPPGMRRR